MADDASAAAPAATAPEHGGQGPAAHYAASHVRYRVATHPATMQEDNRDRSRSRDRGQSGQNVDIDQIENITSTLAHVLRRLSALEASQNYQCLRSQPCQTCPPQHTRWAAVKFTSCCRDCGQGKGTHSYRRPASHYVDAPP